MCVHVCVTCTRVPVSVCLCVSVCVYVFNFSTSIHLSPSFFLSYSRSSPVVSLPLLFPDFRLILERHWASELNQLIIPLFLPRILLLQLEIIELVPILRRQIRNYMGDKTGGWFSQMCSLVKAATSHPRWLYGKRNARQCASRLTTALCRSCWQIGTRYVRIKFTVCRQSPPPSHAYLSSDKEQKK